MDEKTSIANNAEQTTSEYTTFVHGFEIKYVSHYAMSVLNDSVFNNHEHWFYTENKSPVIIDAGSNIGCVALYLKHHYPNARVICFEPDELIFSLLKDNINNNKLTNVELHQCALGTHDGECTFYSSADTHLSGGLGNSIKLDWGIQESPDLYDRSRTVPVRKLSSFIDQKIDYLKLDVERAEWEVVSEIEHKLSLVKQIHVEVHSIDEKNTEEVDNILSLLHRHNFYCETESTAPDLPPWTHGWADKAKPKISSIRGVNLAHLDKEVLKKRLQSIEKDKVLA